MNTEEKKIRMSNLPRRLVTLSVAAALGSALIAGGIISAAPLKGALSFLGAAAGNAGATGWRSALYPNNWSPATPDAQGRFLHDFSYAGYHRGEDPIPNRPPGKTYDVTKPPYNADKKGDEDATQAIQKAIDDAGASGGGIVYLPAGTYKVSVQDANAPAALTIEKSGVVLQGEGYNKTFIYNRTTNMREKAVIRVRTPNASLTREDPARSSPLTKNYKLPTTRLAVKDASKFSPGDWVAVVADLTRDRIQDLNMRGRWDTEKPWLIYMRKVVAVNRSNNTITIDIPTRYELLVRDNARVYVITGPIEEVGIEKLSIGNEKNPRGGWDTHDYEREGTGAYQVHASQLIRIVYAANSWVRNVRTYEPRGNGGVHLLSIGVQLLEGARSITLSGVRVQNAQYVGGGGNGYGIHIFGGENLVEDCEVARMRHNIVFWGPVASGNVLTNCTLRGGEAASEFHGHFSAANLLEKITLSGGEELAALDRGNKGDSYHGLTSSESVFWNIIGNGRLISEQYGWGYVIGTAAGVYVDTEGNDSRLTQPTDFVEGRGRASTLEPQSLYRNQLNRRLSLAVGEQEAAEETAMAEEDAPAQETPRKETEAKEEPATQPTQQKPVTRTAVFRSAGTHTFTIPSYKTLTVEVWGGGGGGGSNANKEQVGGSGGQSSFAKSVIARGGKGGQAGIKNTVVFGGAGGTAQGGDVNKAGDAGTNGKASGSGSGGNAPNGGAGGKGASAPADTTPVEGKNGSAPGGGGSGTAKTMDDGSFNNGAGGGAGGYAKKTYAQGELAPGTQVVVVVGAGGKGSTTNADGGSGARGEVRITWTE